EHLEQQAQGDRRDEPAGVELLERATELVERNVAEGEEEEYSTHHQAREYPAGPTHSLTCLTRPRSARPGDRMGDRKGDRTGDDRDGGAGMAAPPRPG